MGPVEMLLVGRLTTKLFPITGRAGRIGLEPMFFNRPERFHLFAGSAGLG